MERGKRKGSRIMAYLKEQWRLVKIACKTYSDKLACARRHYHKTKQLKGKRPLDEPTPCMAITNEISGLEAKPLTEVCLIKNQVDTNPKPEVCLNKSQVETNLKPEVCLNKSQVETKSKPKLNERVGQFKSFKSTGSNEEVRNRLEMF